eukprot:1156570-Pelagomonas_calceolata.AAC.5
MGRGCRSGGACVCRPFAHQLHAALGRTSLCACAPHLQLLMRLMLLVRRLCMHRRGLSTAGSLHHSSATRLPSNAAAVIIAGRGRYAAARGLLSHRRRRLQQPALHGAKANTPTSPAAATPVVLYQGAKGRTVSRHGSAPTPTPTPLLLRYRGGKQRPSEG